MVPALGWQSSCAALKRCDESCFGYRAVACCSLVCNILTIDRATAAAAAFPNHQVSQSGCSQPRKDEDDCCGLRRFRAITRLSRRAHALQVHIRTGGRNFDATGTVISSEDEVICTAAFACFQANDALRFYHLLCFVQALHIAATARCLLADGQDSSPTCKFNINACEAINSTAACPRARIFFASDDSKLKQDAVTWYGCYRATHAWFFFHRRLGLGLVLWFQLGRPNIQGRSSGAAMPMGLSKP